jgi:hypothetical protein
MRVEVRDDIISLDSFIQAKMKYEEFLMLLRSCGNYCFLDQFKRHFGPQGEYAVRCMEEYNLIKMESLNNNYKYIYLTDTAMKYLVLKDDPRDFSDVKKNLISVQKVNKYPSEKQLFSSALKLELIVNDENELLIKENLIDYWKTQFYGQYNISKYEEQLERLAKEYNEKKAIFEEQRRKNKNIIAELTKIAGDEMANSSEELKKIYKEQVQALAALENENDKIGRFDKNRKEQINNRISELKQTIELTKFKAVIKARIESYNATIVKEINTKAEEINRIVGLYKKANELVKSTRALEGKFEGIKKKIVGLYDISKIITYIKNETLCFIILDTGNFKSAYSYMKIINEIKGMGMAFTDIVITIASYSKGRAKGLKEEFEEVRKEKVKGEKMMSDYEKAKNLDRKNRANWQYTPPKHYTAAENIYYNTPDIMGVIIDKNTTKLDVYKKNLALTDNYIKRKDKEAIEILKNSLKKMAQDQY